MSHCNEEKFMPIGKKDEFMMPVIDFDLSRTYEKIKLPVLNKNFQGYEI